MRVSVVVPVVLVLLSIAGALAAPAGESDRLPPPPPPPAELPAVLEALPAALADFIPGAREGPRTADEHDEYVEEPILVGGKANEFDNDIPFERPLTNATIGTGGSFDASFAWFVTRQSEDGSFGGDVATTGLVLLSFLGAGETHKSGRFKKQVKQALKYLKANQDAEWGFGTGDDHAIATLAMCEAYAMTNSPLFKLSAQRGVDRLFSWRDASLLWEVLVWNSAKLAGLRLPEGVKDKIVDAIEWESDVATRALARQLTGEKGNAEDLHTVLSVGPSDADPVFTLVGTLVAFRRGGETWKDWQARLKSNVLAHERSEGESKGSWDGELTKTALLKLSLLSCLRYRCYRGGSTQE